MLSRWILKLCVIGLFFLNTPMIYAGEESTQNPQKKELIQLLKQLSKEQLIQLLDRCPLEMQNELLEHLSPSILNQLQLSDPWKKQLIQKLDQLPVEIQNEILKHLFPSIKDKLLSAMVRQKDKTVWVSQEHTDKVNSMAISPDGKTLASASDDKTIKFWDLKSGKVEKTLTYDDHVKSIVFQPDGGILATGTPECCDKKIKIWNLSGVKKTLTNRGIVGSIALSPDGHTLALVLKTNMIRLWNIDSGKVEKTLENERNGCAINCIAFSPDGKTLAAGDKSTTTRVWNVKSGEIEKVFHHEGWIGSVAFSPSGKILATDLYSTEDGKLLIDKTTIQLWNVTNQKTETLTSTRKHWVESIAFSPDENTIAIGFTNGTIEVWNVYDPEILNILYHPEYHFSPTQLFLLYLLSESTGENRLTDWDTYLGEKYGPNRSEFLQIRKTYESLPEKIKTLAKECFNVIES